MNDEIIISKKDVQIFKGKYFLSWVKFNNKFNISPNSKIVVFDLDETLGSFADLYIIWCGILHIWNDCPYFNRILDTFPEFLRFGIIIILQYLYSEKINKKCDKIFLYTNNQCSIEWVRNIIDYFESKILIQDNIKLFDKIIGAFKINNKISEFQRSSHLKNIDDLKRCSNINDDNFICFIDDVIFPDMKGSNVYYLCPRAYQHSLDYKTILKRIHSIDWFPKGKKYSLLNNSYYWKSWINFHKRKVIKKGKDNMDLHILITQKLLNHIRYFLNYKIDNKNITPKKKYNNKNNITRKKK
jgi:hypothetical protein